MNKNNPQLQKLRIAQYKLSSTIFSLELEDTPSFLIEELKTVLSLLEELTIEMLDPGKV